MLNVSESAKQKYTTEYLKDVSSLLAMVSAVQTLDFECHLQQKSHGTTLLDFYHVKHATCITYRPVLLPALEHDNHLDIIELKT